MCRYAMAVYRCQVHAHNLEAVSSAILERRPNSANAPRKPATKTYLAKHARTFTNTTTTGEQHTDQIAFCSTISSFPPSRLDVSAWNCLRCSSKSRATCMDTREIELHEGLLARAHRAALQKLGSFDELCAVLARRVHFDCNIPLATTKVQEEHQATSARKSSSGNGFTPRSRL